VPHSRLSAVRASMELGTLSVPSSHHHAMLCQDFDCKLEAAVLQAMVPPSKKTRRVN